MHTRNEITLQQARRRGGRWLATSEPWTPTAAAAERQVIVVAGEKTEVATLRFDLDALRSTHIT